MDLPSNYTCASCNKEIHTLYCGNCGQKKNSPITLSYLYKLFKSAILESKSPFIYTLIQLTINPSKVVTDYINGRRIVYFNPIKFAFWMVTLSILVATATGVDMVKSSISGMQADIAASKNFDSVVSFLENGLAYVFYFYAVPLALITRAFMGPKYTSIELYTVHLFLMGQLTLISILALIVGIYQEAMVQFGMLVITVFYTSITITRMYQPTKWHFYLKAFFATVIGWLVASFVMGFVAGLVTATQEDMAKQLPKPVVLSEKNN